ncbi:reverse transcriptase domain-containing protein, partial [Acinetobacter baumannii]|uniref:reverse transcriptase domain-containing protein n=1 Tax=Acinetobacter baumannii TaxID=470 RepID=UPI00339A25C4
YGELSETFPTVSGVHQGCPISPFLFNFVIDVIMEECLAVSPGHGVQVLPGSKLLDLDYADDIVLLFDSVTAVQQTLHRLCEAVPSFGMRFAPSKCKVLPQDIQLLGSALRLQGEEFEVVDHFTYLG